MITFEELKKLEVPYDVKKLKSWVIILRRTKNPRTEDRGRELLFKMMGRIIVKQISSFLYLTKDYRIEVFHGKDSLINEAYIVFDRCLKKCKVEQIDSFMFFFNTALSREFTRIRHKNYDKHFKSNNITSYTGGDREKESMFDIGVRENVDFVDYYINGSGFNFNEKEKKILLSKVRGDKVSDFLEENRETISQNDYYKTLGNIKNKLKILR